MLKKPEKVGLRFQVDKCCFLKVKGADYVIESL